MTFEIVSESHLDHGLAPAQIELLSALFVERDGFFVETVTLPAELGTVPCALHGPAMGDQPVADADVVHIRRGERGYSSRLCNRAPRQSALVTVIAGPHGESSCVLYTAFGGPLAPKEASDPSLGDEDRAASEAFWAEHALSLDDFADENSCEACGEPAPDSYFTPHGGDVVGHVCFCLSCCVELEEADAPAERLRTIQAR